MLITVLFYFYFNLKVKNSFKRRLSLDEAPTRVLTDNSNSYIMPQPTNVFCHAILIFAKFEM